MTTDELFRIVLIPGAVSGLTAGLAVWWLSRGSASAGRRGGVRSWALFALPALAMAGAFWWSLSMLEGGVVFPPRERWQWLGVVLLLVAPVALYGAGRGQQRDDGWRKGFHPREFAVVALLLAAVMVIGLRPPPVVTNPWWWIMGTALLSIAWWWGAGPLAERRAPRTWDAAIFLSMITLAVVFLGGRFLKLALLTAAVAIAFGMLMVVAWTPPPGVRAAAAITLAAFLPAAVAVGWFYRQSGLHPSAFLLPLVAPLLLWLSCVRESQRWCGSAVAGVVLVNAIAIAIVLGTAGLPTDLG